MHDLVSYDVKHNEANKDENKDGSDDNNSWNCGAEGASTDPAIVALREKQKRNFLATLLLSQGVPMICGGDECGRTQSGNNNGYCQDNEITWTHWDWDDRRKALFEFAGRVLRLRSAHPSFRRRTFSTEFPAEEPERIASKWYRADGKEMADEDWENGGWMRTLGMFLDGRASVMRQMAEGDVENSDFLLLLNAHSDAVDFQIPKQLARSSWTIEFDTSDVSVGGPVADAKRRIEGRSTVLLSRRCPALRKQSRGKVP
jgi:glycogen operon protein